jgi:hypothetical protein
MPNDDVRLPNDIDPTHLPYFLAVVLIAPHAFQLASIFDFLPDRHGPILSDSASLPVGASPFSEYLLLHGISTRIYSDTGLYHSC